jgi:tetratricopeptide (TPR) repeat protein
LDRGDHQDAHSFYDSAFLIGGLAMKPKSSFTMICLVALTASAFLVAGCSPYKARREMAQGKQNYRETNFSEAAEHFKTAALLEDDWIAAKFALAAAYASQVVPGVYTPENQRNGQQAISVYLAILQRDPRNTNALKNIGIIYTYLGGYDQAYDYFKKAVAAAPDDPDLGYLLGAADWMAAYKSIRNYNTQQGLRMDDEFKKTQSGRQLCEEVRAANLARVDEGLVILQKAIGQRQDYDDAMAYTSLLYQLKADIECGNPQARVEDLRLFRKWTDEGVDARARKGAKQQESASRHPRALDEGLETGTVALLFAPPPPPPPPPPMPTTKKQTPP